MYSRTTIEFYFAESDKKRATRMLKSIFLTARLPQTKEANYGYKYLHCHIARKQTSSRSLYYF